MKLSSALRHSAVDWKIPIRIDGYVKISDLLKNKNFKNNVTVENILMVVSECKKNRFELSTDVSSGELLIRARQGHSMKLPHVDASLIVTEITDPAQLPALIVHGTFHRCMDSIMQTGLSRMKRNHIHMAKGYREDVASGYRHDCQVLITIDAAKAMASGIKFFESGNGVILSPGDANGSIGAEYFKSVEDCAPSSSAKQIPVTRDSSSSGNGTTYSSLFLCLSEHLELSWPLSASSIIHVTFTTVHPLLPRVVTTAITSSPVVL